jgi:hypothetical protein
MSLDNTRTTTETVLQHWMKATPDHLHIHPDDAVALRSNSHAFELDTLVGPWMGPIRTAEVVLLYLNPGVNRAGTGEEVMAAQDSDVRAEMIQNLHGSAPLPSFKSNPKGYKWTTEKLEQFGVSYAAASSKVAFLNLMPYRSDDGSKDAHMRKRLKSSLLMLEWAQDTLFPEARSGKRVVVCMRSARLWGLQNGQRYGEALYAPETNRSGYILHRPTRGPAREEVAKAVRARVFGLSELRSAS